MAGIFDFLNSFGDTIPDEVKARRLQDWQNSTTQAGDDALRARTAAQELAADRAMGQGKITADRQAATRAATLADEAWGRSASAATGRQALGTLGRAAVGIPGTAAQLLTYSPDAGDASDELSAAQIRKEMGDVNANAQEADAGRYKERIQQNTRDAATGYQNRPISLMAPQDQDLDSQGDIAVAQSALQDQQQPPVVQTPVGPAAESNPTTVAQAAAKTAQDQETYRQTVQAGALQGLSTGQVSRPQIAAEIATADAQRAGKELTPEQHQEAVKQELGVMKTMDNQKLSEYVSYALIAGGLLASFADKSGRAGDQFSSSFNKQLDRNLQAGKLAQQQKAAQAKLDQQLLLKQGDWQRQDRGIDIKQQVADQTGDYQEGQLGIGQTRNKIAQQNADVNQSQGAANIGLRKAGLLQSADQFDRRLAQQEDQFNRTAGQGDRRLDLQGEGNAIRAAQVAAKSASSKPGVALTEKGAGKVVDDFFSAQGTSIDSKAKSGLASQVQQASKNDPRWASNPAAVINDILNRGGYEVGTDPGIPFVPFTGGSRQIRQKKQQ